MNNPTFDPSDGTFDISGTIDPLTPYTPGSNEPAFFARGQKQYELSNHLGNVLVTITDRKLQVGSSSLDYFTADIIAAKDYYPFGMEMPERGFSAAAYRFGFQGQETDQEFMGGAVSYKYRVHDARIGRFLSIDPLAPKYPHNSPYAFSENIVIHGVELEGLEVEYTENIDNDGNTVIDIVTYMDVRDVTIEGINLSFDEVIDENATWQVGILSLAKSQIEETYSGEYDNDDGTKTIVNTVVKFSKNDEAVRGRDFFIEFVSGKLDGKDAKEGSPAYTDRVGALISNRIQVSVRNTFSSSKNVIKIITHEFGHVFGLHHPKEKKSVFRQPYTNSEGKRVRNTAMGGARESGKQNSMNQSGDIRRYFGLNTFVMSVSIKTNQLKKVIENLRKRGIKKKP